jgi:hypothetical protein
VIFEHLSSTNPPWIILSPIGGTDRQFTAEHVYTERGKLSRLVRVLRCKKMRTREGLLSEMGAALQFFPQFGENWTALADCLYYLDEWLPAPSYCLVFWEADLLLADEPDELGILVDVLARVGEWWQKPITDNDGFNRPAIPFHAVLKVVPEKLELVHARLRELNYDAMVASVD